MTQGKVHILPVLRHEPDRPRQGFFAVKLGKGLPERALSVTTIAGKCQVLLDGAEIGCSYDWREAFGKLAGKDCLIGTPISYARYVALIKARKLDASTGADLARPVNINGAPPPF